MELELVAGENSKPQVSSRDSTSPAEFVTAMVGHENSDSDGEVKTVVVAVDWLVTVLVIVTTSVSVSNGVQEACLAPSAALRMAGTAAALLVLVVLGGLYDSAQSVSSSSVAF